MPKISHYAAATSAADADIAVIVQGGATKRIALSVLKAYMGGSDIQNNFAGAAAPGATDDEAAGYAVGSVWIDTTADPMEAYRCGDATEGAAVWLKTTLTIDELGSKADKIATSPDPTGFVATFVSNGNLALSATLVEDILQNDDIDGMVTSADFTTIVKCTQAEYDALSPADANTLYIIVAE